MGADRIHQIRVGQKVFDLTLAWDSTYSYNLAYNQDNHFHLMADAKLSKIENNSHQK